jgi:hypothetical protein
MDRSSILRPDLAHLAVEGDDYAISLGVLLALE